MLLGKMPSPVEMTVEEKLCSERSLLEEPWSNGEKNAKKGSAHKAAILPRRVALKLSKDWHRKLVGLLMRCAVVKSIRGIERKEAHV
jgi:hypothetical protein